jgi:hypothetical protein
MFDAFFRTSDVCATLIPSINPNTEPVMVPMHPPNAALLNNSGHRNGTDVVVVVMALVELGISPLSVAATFVDGDEDDCCCC